MKVSAEKPGGAVAIWDVIWDPSSRVEAQPAVATNSSSAIKNGKLDRTSRTPRHNRGGDHPATLIPGPSELQLCCIQRRGNADRRGQDFDAGTGRGRVQMHHRAGHGSPVTGGGTASDDKKGLARLIHGTCRNRPIMLYFQWVEREATLAKSAIAHQARILGFPRVHVKGRSPVNKTG